LNFSLLNPLFLIGLSAVLLPIIAHLISRKSGVKKGFSAVSLLLSSQGQSARKSRIKDLLLLFLRSLVLVMLVLVFSKPALFSFSPVNTTEPKSVAIVVDNSLSMAYGDNFEVARKRAEQIIDSLGDGSFGAVLPLVPEDDIKPDITVDKSRMKEDLESIKQSYSFTDNERRLEEVFGLIQKAPNREKEVILITDLQRNGWRRENFSRAWLVPVDVLSGKDMENRTISEIDFEDEGESIRIMVHVGNFSRNGVKNLLATVSLGNQEIKGFFEIEPDGEEIKEFIFPKDRLPSGDLLGKVEIEHDNLTLDDVRYFVLPENRGLRVLMVDGDPREDARLGETYYLARAVETISEISPLSLEIEDNDTFLDDELKKYDLILLTNVGDITPEKAEEIENRVKDGAVLVIFPGDRVKSEVYNALFKILPAELGVLSEGEYFLKATTSDGPFAQDIGGYDRAEVKKLFSLKPANDSIILLNSSNDSPFLLRRDVESGSVFLFASTADTSWNSFPLTPVFLPTVKKIFDLSQDTQSRRRNFTVGDMVDIAFAKQAEELTVITPNGEKFRVARERPRFSHTRVPGIYRVDDGAESLYSFSVNTDPRESDLERTLLETIPQEHDEKSGLVKVFREIWGYFLWGVIALFISESIFRVLYYR
jgi:hypothetical protein